jgi:hypothetical protein
MAGVVVAAVDSTTNSAPGDDFAGGVVLDRQLPICELPFSEVAPNTRPVDSPTLLFQRYRHVDPLAARSDRP